MPGEIRLVRSNVILYSSLIVRLAVSVGFTIIVARKLSVEEFAAFGLILAFATIAQVITTIWVFWAQRWASRGEYEGVGAGLALTLAYSLIILPPLYLGFAALESWALGISFDLTAGGWAFVILAPIQYYLSNITLVVRPGRVGLMRVVYEVLRFLLGYILVVPARWGFGGAVLSMTAASSITGLGYIILLERAGVREGGVNWGLAAYWLRNWRLPLLYMVSRIMRLFNRPYISWLTGSSEAVAYLNVAVTSETPLMMASSVTSMPMYSRILRKPRGEDVEVSLVLYLIFTGMLSSIFIGAPRAIADLYNPRYLASATALQLVAVLALFSGVANIIRQALLALDQPEAAMSRIDRNTLLSRTLEYSALLAVAPYVFAAPLVYMLRGDPVSSLNAFLLVLIAFSLLQLSLFSVWLRRRLYFTLKNREVLAVAGAFAGSLLYLHVSGVNRHLYPEFWRELVLLTTHSAIALLVYSVILVVFSPTARRLVGRGLEVVGLR